LEKYILPTESVLPYEALTVSSRNHTKLLNGMKVAVDAQDGLYKFYNEDGSFYGLAEVQGGLAKLKTKLCL
jgi:hypothetical protein